MTDNVVDSLLEMERAGWDSLCDSTGSEFYGATMLADAVMVLANGMVMDRRTVVNALSESPPWRTYEISDVRCIPIDDDNAALVYTGTAWRDGANPRSGASCRACTTAPVTRGDSRSISRRRCREVRRSARRWPPR